MTVDFQATLFDGLDTGAEAAAPALGDLGSSVRRTPLTAGAWVDVRPGWVTAADDLFLRLVREVPWYAERRQMYERVVAVPRLLRFYGADEVLPDPLLTEARERLSTHYREELREPFTTAGMCLYRDGRDSVAWHGDRIGRSRTQDTMVAIVSLGEARRLMLRPRPGAGVAGGTISFTLGHGDLIVMGGSCQRTWEHAVPKSTRPVGPRVSVQFRPHGVR